jgi:aldose 1-epimerase
LLGDDRLPIRLELGDYLVEVDPQRGGSILRLDFAGEPVMRRTCGPSILDVACFPLVPFSNRIENGDFTWEERVVHLSPNLPGSDHPHPLHGFGWLACWRIIEAGASRCVIEHRYEPGEWPWRYSARQTFQLNDAGLTVCLTVTNRSEDAMPAGLGFHPYFPRDDGTVYLGLHRGEWRNRRDCLPQRVDLRDSPLDWWHGQSVGSRLVDTVYTGREGSLRIAWPSRGIRLNMIPSHNLDHTVVFTPSDADYFCVEPVSHATNAVNVGTMGRLGPGASTCASIRLTVEKIRTP